MKRYLDRLPLLVTLSGLLLCGCNVSNGPQSKEGQAAAAEAKPAKPAEPEFYTVAGQRYVETVDLPGGSIHGMESTQLMSKLGGYVKTISTIRGEEVDIGSTVKKDEVLAVIAVPEMADELAQKDALVAQAQANVTVAQAARQQADAQRSVAKTMLAEAQAAEKLRKTEERRVKELVARESLRGDKLDEATFARESASAAVGTARAKIQAEEANYNKALADIKAAEARLNVATSDRQYVLTMMEYAKIKAPFDGVVAGRNVDHGAFVRSATSNSGAMPLFKITRIDKVRVVAAVPMTKAAKITVGQNAVFDSIGGLPGVAIAGTITRSAVAFDHASRMLRIDVHFDNPVKDVRSGKAITLKPGMFGTVRVTVSEHDNLPVVPTTAVAVDAKTGASYVVIVDDEKARRQTVDVVFNDAANVGITGSIRVGERVLLKDLANY